MALNCIVVILICFRSVTGQHLDKTTTLIVVAESKPLTAMSIETLKSAANLAGVKLLVTHELNQNLTSDASAALLYVSNSCTSIVNRQFSMVMTLLLEKECPKPIPDHVVVLPGYNVLDGVRWSCLLPTLTRLLIHGNIRSAQRKMMRALWSHLVNGFLDPAHEYLECGGLPDQIPRLMPLMLSRTEQLQMGNKFLTGHSLVVATLHRQPFVKLSVTQDKEVITASGFCIEMLNVLANKHNFSYKLVLPSDNKWGNAAENGTFNGMIGMVMREEVDMAIGSFTITQTREEVVDFTHPFYEEPTAILLPAPHENTNALAFLEPFTYKVWILMLCSAALVGPVVWLLTERTGDWAPILYPHRTKKGTLLEYVSDAAFGLIGQSDPRIRMNESSRTLMGMYYMYCVILNYTYTSTLIAFLTIPRLSRVISSLEELANQREILWTYLANTAHEKLFEEATLPSTYYKIGQLVKERNLMVKTNEEGINNVFYKNMAFIKEKSYLDTAMEDDYLKTGKCRLTLVPQLFFSAPFGWALETNSVYRPLFNTEILRMMQSGLFTVWKSQYWPKPNQCTAGVSSQAGGARSLRMKDLSGHWTLLGLGSLMSMGVFLLEQVVARYQKLRVSHAKSDDAVMDNPRMQWLRT